MEVVDFDPPGPIPSPRPYVLGRGGAGPRSAKGRTGAIEGVARVEDVLVRTTGRCGWIDIFYRRDGSETSSMERTDQVDRASVVPPLGGNRARGNAGEEERTMVGQSTVSVGRRASDGAKRES